MIESLQSANIEIAGNNVDTSAPIRPNRQQYNLRRNFNISASRELIHERNESPTCCRAHTVNYKPDFTIVVESTTLATLLATPFSRETINPTIRPSIF